MAEIEIVHRHAEGTVAGGTRRGDGAGEILKAKGWRWSGHLGAWFLPHSRDRSAKTGVIKLTEEALAVAGFEVSVDIDDSAMRPIEEREAERAERIEARGERLQERAEKRRSAAEAMDAAVHQISDGIPLGQPIIVGHHSERRHRRDIERIQDLTSNSVAESRAADEDQRRADTLAGATEYRYSVKAVGRRIERLEGRLRKVDRYLEAGFLTDELVQQRNDLEDQIAYWHGIRDENAATQPTYSPETISKGDLVRVSGLWRRVERVNQKSVSVETGFPWTARAPYHDITDHRSPNDIEANNEPPAP
ncbi:DUF3560 domain-containing protein [Kribbella sp. NPDC051620]|uniref:DUF3560 domain-containing protein n=1 Tax=Kribbella sp. NPDC051620 TaxID=3364120 RepID=UPI003793FA51